VLARRDEIIAAETRVLRDLRPALIIADIPFLAGDVAEAVGIPCVAMSNFTWDWIAEPFANAFPERRPLIDAISRSYAKMTAILRMPLGGVSGAFREVIDVPLVANQARRMPADVLQILGIDSKDRRPRALFGMRGAIPTETLALAARSMPDVLLLCPTNEPGDVPAGVVPVPLGAGSPGQLDFSDVLRVCDVVIGKMGYGLVAECIASGVSLLWPRRTGFREDDVVEREGPKAMRMRELPVGDFNAGNWAEHLRAAIALPPSPEQMRADGAEICAAWIARRVLT
jgi:L-arabinokinase